MKKIIFLKLIFVFFIFILCSVNFPQAKVTGECSNCHTMHNSQNGQPMTFDNSSTPYPALTRGDCIGCHSNTGSATIKILGSSRIPIIYNINGGTTDPGALQSWNGTNYNLAGGNFYYVIANGSAYGHNVEGIANADSTLGNTPPGYNSTLDPSTVKYNTNYRLTCAGSNGCHGNRNVDRSSYTNSYEASFFAVRGAHHEDDSSIDGSTVGKSYRFLKGVKGIEDSDWQQSASTTDHNEYKGATAQNVSDTISYLCRNCHGNFHAAIGSSSPWLRHPTDTDVISKGGEYENYGGSQHTYNLLAPVGYTTTPSSPRETVSSGDSPVMCLSCHRAHASPYWKMLRWDYKGWPGSGTNGCNVCHTSKN